MSDIIERLNNAIIRGPLETPAWVCNTMRDAVIYVAKLEAENAALAEWKAMLLSKPAEKRIAALEGALTEVDGCFEAALIEGWVDALADGDMERIRDLYNRRICYAREAAIRAIQSAGYPKEQWG